MFIITATYPIDDATKPTEIDRRDRLIEDAAGYDSEFGSIDAHVRQLGWYSPKFHAAVNIRRRVLKVAEWATVNVREQ